jgi:hypothetical protein
MHRLAIPVGDVRRRKAAVGVVIIGDRQRNLLEVSGSGCRHGGDSCVTHGRIENHAQGAHNQDHDRKR